MAQGPLWLQKPRLSRLAAVRCTDREVGAVDHQTIARTALSGQGREDSVEHAHAASAHEPVGEGLGVVLAAGASHQLRPWRITEMMLLCMRRSSTRGVPWESERAASAATGGASTRAKAGKGLWDQRGGPPALLRVTQRRVATSDEWVLSPGYRPILASSSSRRWRQVWWRSTCSAPARARSRSSGKGPVASRSRMARAESASWTIRQ